MSEFPEGLAIVYCEGNFDTGNGKTAHGLVRRTQRYRVLSVVDSHLAGKDAGELLDGKAKGIRVLKSVNDAIETAKIMGTPATHLVIGLAPIGGRLQPSDREAIKGAIRARLNVDSGLHDFLSDDPEIAALAREHGVTLRDVRKTPPRSQLHAFTGKIEEVKSLRLALLGTDSAIGKRTTAGVLVEALRAAGQSAYMIGTGQTAWMQGVEAGIILDSLINDFVAGELEHACVSLWEKRHPDVMVVEGQGSLMNPGFPGGLEILAATRPHGIILQHAPLRREYDGFKGYALHPIQTQIQALELTSGRKVVAVTLNHEGLRWDEIPAAVNALASETGLPVVDVLTEGGARLVEVLTPWMEKTRGIR